MEPSQSIRTGNACIKVWRRKPTRCIKIGDGCIKIWSRLNVLRYAMHVLGYGAESRKPSQCIKIVNACIKIWSQWINLGGACIRIWTRVFSVLWDFFEVFSQGSRADIHYARCLPPVRLRLPSARTPYRLRVPPACAPFRLRRPYYDMT